MPFITKCNIRMHPKANDAVIQIFDEDDHLLKEYNDVPLSGVAATLAMINTVGRLEFDEASQQIFLTQIVYLI